MPQAELPTPARLKQLPRWARVAYAARCARRVQSLAETSPVELTAAQQETIENAIHLAETVAADAPARADDHAVVRLHSAFRQASRLARAVKKRDPVASAVATAAAEAAASAEHACSDARTADANHAAKSAQAAGTADPSPEMRAALHKDWQALAEAARTHGWTNATPVPADFFRR